MPAKLKSVRWRSYFYLIINTICWGAALIAVKPALSFISPSTYLFYRFAMASLLSLPIIFHFWKKIKNLGKNLLIITLLEMLGTTVALWVLYTGLTLTSAINASLVGTTGPIFIVIVSLILLKEREEKREWLGLLTSFVGTLLLVLIPVFSGGYQNGNAPNPLLGNALIISYNVLIGLYFPLAKKYYAKLPKLFVSSISFLVGAISFGLITLAEKVPSSRIGFFSQIVADFQHPEVWFATLYMAIFGSIIGLTAYIKGQDGIEASEASLFAYLQPLIYLPLGVIFLGEFFSPLSLVGLVLVVGGLLISERRATSRSRS